MPLSGAAMISENTAAVSSSRLGGRIAGVKGANYPAVSGKCPNVGVRFGPAGIRPPPHP